MTLDRSALVAELANVRAQQQNFVRLVEQASGAEKAILGLIGLIDKMEVENAVHAPANEWPAPQPSDAHPDEVVDPTTERRMANRILPLSEQDAEPEPTDYDLGRYERQDAPASTGAAS